MPMIVRKTVDGNTREIRATKSHPPSPATWSMSSAASFCCASRRPLTRPGEKYSASTWRHFAWSGGSIMIGIHLYGGSGSVGTMTLLDQSSGCWSPSRITEFSVKTQ